MKPPNLLILESNDNPERGLAYQLIRSSEIGAVDIELSDGKRIQLSSVTKVSDDLPEIQACAFVDATALIPKAWEEWFSSEFDCEVSFGDANRTLIDVETFLKGADNIDWEEHGVSEEEVDAWTTSIEKLGNIYIDLEN